MPNKTTPPPWRAHAIELTEQGASMAEVAEQCGVSMSAVYNTRKRYKDFKRAMDEAKYRYYDSQIHEGDRRTGDVYKVFDELMASVDASADPELAVKTITAAARTIKTLNDNYRASQDRLEAKLAGTLLVPTAIEGRLIYGGPTRSDEEELGSDAGESQESNDSE